MMLPPPPPITGEAPYEQIDVQRLYGKRFEKDYAAQNADAKNAVWKILCKHFFQAYIPKESSVIDIAAGYCEFINNIQAAQKTAFDINPDTPRFAAQDVRSIQKSFFEMNNILDRKCDIIFASNVLEHLDSKEQVVTALKVCAAQLHTGGKLLILQPNIRYTKGAYWDFIDHKTPLTEKSLAEAGALCGLTPEKIIARFLPYTTRSALPQHPAFVFLYLKLPLAWRIFGQQSFLVLRKNVDNSIDNQQQIC